MAIVNSNIYFKKLEYIVLPYFRSQKNGENPNKFIITNNNNNNNNNNNHPDS
jgi:hypothetical protein